jgi:hypothetical protein
VRLVEGVAAGSAVKIVTGAGGKPHWDLAQYRVRVPVPCLSSS